MRRKRMRKRRKKRRKGRRRKGRKIVAVIVFDFVAVLQTFRKYHEHCSLEYLIRSVFLSVPDKSKHMAILLLCEVKSSDT